MKVWCGYGIGVWCGYTIHGPTFSWRSCALFVCSVTWVALRCIAGDFVALS